MEQKLAEFRARRQAEKAAQKSETTGSQSRGETAADTAAQCDKTPTADSLRPEDRARNNQTATDGSQSSVRDNFKLVILKIGLCVINRVLRLLCTNSIVLQLAII